jgi:hypothetical protein
MYRELQLAPEALKTRCLEFMKQLMTHQLFWVFRKPVDPIDLGLRWLLTDNKESDGFGYYSKTS